MFTVDGSRQDRFLVTIFPAVLNTRSDGTDVAGMLKFFWINVIIVDNERNLPSTMPKDHQ